MSREATADDGDLRLEIERLRARVNEFERREAARRELQARSEQDHRLGRFRAERAERALRTSRQWYRLLIERMNEGFVTTDRENRVDIINAKLSHMLGYSREEVHGQYLGNFVDEANRRVLEEQEDRRHQGLAEPYELVWQAKDERRVETVVSPTSLLDDEGQFVGSFAVVTDVTERNRMKRERRKLQARVRKAQKMESLGLLAGGVAHDFNNLLVGILGHAGLALMEMPEDSSLRPLIQQIETAAIRASELTNEMLAYSGKGRFMVEEIDIAELVREMIHLLDVTISKSVALETDFAQDLAAMEGDPTQIRQVVMNLITNAAEALGDEVGTITIATGRIEADRSYLAGTFLDDDLPAGRYVFLEVSDTGPGMEPETRSKIFDPFFTTKFTGRGLGLAAVLGIVRGHRGAIRVYSEVGRGTSFKLLFPATDAVVQPKAEPPVIESPPFRGSGCVLVADDEEMVRRVAKLTLENAGYTVLLAVDGVEAVESFRRHHDELHAVLLDLTMPRMGGEEAYREIRRIRADAKIILSSGFNEQDSVGRFSGEHLAGFLQKPFQPRELIEKIRQIVE
ncbi:MAG: ATP-binding protein [Acidobacteriota bacterium]